MNISTALMVLASLTLLITGCSKQSPSTRQVQSTDLGVIDVSSGKPSRHTLADGRTCLITPTVLPDGNVSLKTQIDETNGSMQTLVCTVPANGRVVSFAFDHYTIISVALRQ